MVITSALDAGNRGSSPDRLTIFSHSTLYLALHVYIITRLLNTRFAELFEFMECIYL